MKAVLIDLAVFLAASTFMYLVGTFMWLGASFVRWEFLDMSNEIIRTWILVSLWFGIYMGFIGIRLSTSLKENE